MKVRLLYFLAIALLLSSCDLRNPVPEENEALIGDELFQPSESSVSIIDGKLALTFTDGEKRVEINTNDTIQGKYEVIEYSKKASALEATIIYTDGNNTWYGTSGYVTIAMNDGLYEGSYEASLKAEDETEIEISSGNFDGIEAEEEAGTGLLETEAEVLSSLDSCQALFKYYIEYLYIFDALYSNDTLAPAASWSSVYAHNLDGSDAQISALWDKAWTIIGMANLIIESSETAISDISTREQALAQAEVLRAYNYYALLKWFGGVPIISQREQVNVERSSSEDLALFIQADLEHALNYLPVSSSSSALGWFPSASARELLVHIYLNEGDYISALASGQEIIYSNQYALDAGTSNFASDNPEIFNGFTTSGDSDFSKVFKKGDFVPVFRLTETYLACAEAMIMTGQSMEAVNYLNQVRMRRNEDPLMTADSDAVYAQYRTELKAEGSIFTVMKRFDKAAAELQLDSYKLILPIPASALQANALLEQNPGY